MSESAVPVLDAPQPDAAELERRRARSEAIKAGRAKAMAKREANARRAEARKANVRTAAAAAEHGIGAHPGPAAPAEMAREDAPPEVLRRVKRENRDAGWADLPTQYKKPGWDYEYKTITVLGQPVDSADFLEIRNAGWRAETARNWPTLVEPGTPPDAPIERRGQRLYGRPMSLTMEARQEDVNAARQQMYDKTMAASTGQSANRNEAGIPNNRGVRPVPIEISIVGEAG
jgi:hypothetical protein